MKRRAPDPSSQPVAIEGYIDLVRIGSGGFSIVYRAHEMALNRNVAVKVLNAGLASDDERNAFERECRALGQLDHPDIVRVYRSAYTIDDRPCIIMELYDSNFREVLDESGALDPVELLDVGVRMAVALHVAHSKGVLHRDVKPHNIFRSRYGDPALGDFGISTIAGERTHSGSAAGLSVAYAAPEILEDTGTGPATDVYALAATLHHLAAGQAPFASVDIRQAVRKILTAPPPSISRVDLPPGFERVVNAAMAKDPKDRPATALAFAESLREVQARAGHLQTPIKLDPKDASSAGTSSPSTSSPGTSSGRAVLGTARPAMAAVDAQAGIDPSSGATIARRVAPPVEAAVDPPRDLRREWIAAGAVAVAVLAVILGVVLFGGGPGSSSTSSSTTLPPLDSFLAVVAAPVGVTIVPIAGGYSVDIAAVAGATAYIVSPVGSASKPVTVTAAELPLHLVGPASASCVVVQAVGGEGRVSRQAGPFCAQTVTETVTQTS